MPKKKVIIILSLALVVILLGALIFIRYDKKHKNTTFSLNPTNSSDICSVKEIKNGANGFTGTKLPILSANVDGPTAYQVYGSQISGEKTCLTCNPPNGAPDNSRYRMLAHWVPDGKFFLTVVEDPTHPAFSSNSVVKAEEIQNGYWGNLWAVTADGKSWYQLTHYSPQTDGVNYGVLIPVASSTGKVAWAKLISFPTKDAPDAVWKLYLADLVVSNGVPSLQNIKDISAPNTTIFEPQDWSPDGNTLALSADTNIKNVFGWDLFTYSVTTNKYTDLTNTPDQWDEFGRFSPSGNKILWASSSPYPPLPDNLNLTQYQHSLLKMEFWIMNPDGSDKQQLTHFNATGYPEYNDGKSTIATGTFWNNDGTQFLGAGKLNGAAGAASGAGSAFLRQLWVIDFNGACGG